MALDNQNNREIDIEAALASQSANTNAALGEVAEGMYNVQNSVDQMSSDVQSSVDALTDQAKTIADEIRKQTEAAERAREEAKKAAEQRRAENKAKKEEKAKEDAIKNAKKEADKKQMLKLREMGTTYGTIGWIAKTAFKVAGKLEERGAKWQVKQETMYASEGGKGDSSVSIFSKAVARFKEGINEFVSNIFDFKHEKTYLEMAAEKIKDITGYSEEVTGEALSGLNSYFKSKGLGAYAYGAKELEFATTLTKRQQDYGSGQYWTEEQMKSANQQMTQMISSGQGYNTMTGITMNNDVLTGMLRDYAGGKFRTLDQMSEQDRAAFNAWAYNAQLQVLANDGAEELANQINAWSTLGQKINAAKDQLYSFDEVITYNGKTSFGLSDMSDLSDLTIAYDENGVARIISAHDLNVVDPNVGGTVGAEKVVEVAVEAANKFSALFFKFLEATTKGNIADIKYALVPLFEYLGYSSEDAQKTLDYIFDHVDLVTGKSIVWGLLFQAAEGEKPIDYNELVTKVDAVATGKNPQIAFGFTGLEDLETASTEYSNITGTDIKYINIALSDGSQDALAAIRSSYIVFTELTSKQMWERLRNQYETTKALLSQPIEVKINIVPGTTDLDTGGGDHTSGGGGSHGGGGHSRGVDKHKEAVAYLKQKYVDKEDVGIWYDSRYTSLTRAELDRLDAAYEKKYLYYDLDTIATSEGLATGGIVSYDSLYRLGEGNKTEAVIPLESGSGISYLANALREAGAGNETTVYVNLSGQILEMNDYNLNRLGQKIGAAIDNARNRRGTQNYE